jgi:hypothetical protein
MVGRDAKPQKAVGPELGPRLTTLMSVANSLPPSARGPGVSQAHMRCKNELKDLYSVRVWEGDVGDLQCRDHCGLFQLKPQDHRSSA